MYFNNAPLKFVSNSFCYKIVSALQLENHSRYFDETSRDDLLMS